MRVFVHRGRAKDGDPKVATANMKINMVKREAASLSAVREGRDDFHSAEGAIMELKDLIQACNEAISACDKVG